jgi:hypothetical protein
MLMLIMEVIVSFFFLFCIIWSESKLVQLTQIAKFLGPPVSPLFVCEFPMTCHFAYLPKKSWVVDEKPLLLITGLVFYLFMLLCILLVYIVKMNVYFRKGKWYLTRQQICQNHTHAQIGFLSFNFIIQRSNLPLAISIWSKRYRNCDYSVVFSPIVSPCRPPRVNHSFDEFWKPSSFPYLSNYNLLK